MDRICSTCGAAIPEGNGFCGICGQAARQAQDVTQSQPVTQAPAQPPQSGAGIPQQTQQAPQSQPTMQPNIPPQYPPRQYPPTPQYPPQYPPAPGAAKKKDKTAVIITAIVLVAALVVVGVVTKGFGLFNTAGTGGRFDEFLTNINEHIPTGTPGATQSGASGSPGTTGANNAPGSTESGDPADSPGNSGAPGAAHSGAPLTLYPPYLQIPLGQHVTLEAKSDSERALTWSSSNPAAITVDGNGRLTPVAEGEAIITVAFQDDPSVQAYCGVLVTVGGNIFIWEE